MYKYIRRHVFVYILIRHGCEKITENIARLPEKKLYEYVYIYTHKLAYIEREKDLSIARTGGRPRARGGFSIGWIISAISFMYDLYFSQPKCTHVCVYVIIIYTHTRISMYIHIHYIYIYMRVRLALYRIVRVLNKKSEHG